MLYSFFHIFFLNSRVGCGLFENYLSVAVVEEDVEEIIDLSRYDFT